MLPSPPLATPLSTPVPISGMQASLAPRTPRGQGEIGISNLKPRQFGFTNDIESRVAIEQAIKYRDLTIKSWVDSLK